jgi:hypothetical protein
MNRVTHFPLRAKRGEANSGEYWCMQAKQAFASLAIGATVGLTVASLVGIPQLVGPWSIPALLSNALSLWGVVFGGFAAVVTSGVTFAVLTRKDKKKSRWGRMVAGIALALFASGTILNIAMWGVPPFTLVGAWMYPLAIVTAVGAIVMFLPWRRVRDEPPGS